MRFENFDAETTSRVLMKLRAQYGWTQAEAATHCGLSRWSYMQIENGYTEHPRTITLDKIAKGFGISYASLLGRIPLIRLLNGLIKPSTILKKLSRHYADLKNAECGPYPHSAFCRFCGLFC